jgi:hypothetical protein
MERRPPCAILAIALPLSACSAYVPGSLAQRPDVHDARQVGCLDIAARALSDPLIAFTIGNRCRHPVGVDFRNLAVRAWGGAGTLFQPAAADPRDELFEAVLDGHGEAKVTLDFPVYYATPTFCVDVGRLNVDTPAPVPVEMCFRVDGSTARAIAVEEAEVRP